MAFIQELTGQRLDRNPRLGLNVLQQREVRQKRKENEKRKKRRKAGIPRLERAEQYAHPEHKQPSCLVFTHNSNETALKESPWSRKAGRATA